jgi:hypothetical protein
MVLRVYIGILALAITIYAVSNTTLKLFPSNVLHINHISNETTIIEIIVGKCSNAPTLPNTVSK